MQQSRLCTDIYGNKRWFKDGLLHRDGDEPAIICANGTRYWYKHGKLQPEPKQPLPKRGLSEPIMLRHRLAN